MVPDAGEIPSFSFDPSPNQSGSLSAIFLVMHYTAGTSMAAAVSWLKNPAAKASAHLVIGRDGAVVQLVPFNRRAWHAGVSKWGNLEGMNQYSIGIELVNAGKLVRRADGQWITWSKEIIQAADVTIARHKDELSDAGWHEYTDVQIQIALNIATALNASYGFTDILGHDDISPHRKTDPGPLFPMNSFRSRVLGRA
ncbi:MAG: hypothetical protein NVS9B10_20200 [Nevskia sp.]